MNTYLCHLFLYLSDDKKEDRELAARKTVSLPFMPVVGMRLHLIGMPEPLPVIDVVYCECTLDCKKVKEPYFDVDIRGSEDGSSYFALPDSIRDLKEAGFSVEKI